MNTSIRSADIVQNEATESASVGVGLRAVAALIDGFIMFLVGYGIALTMGGTVHGGFELSGRPFFVWLLVAIAYYIVMEARSGDTVGKKLVGLQVARLDDDGVISLRESEVPARVV